MYDKTTQKRDNLVKWNCLSNPSRQQQILLELIANKRNNSKKNLKR